MSTSGGTMHHNKGLAQTPQPSTGNLPDTPCPSPFGMGLRSGIEQCEPIIVALQKALTEVRDGADGRYNGDGMGDHQIVAIADDAISASKVALARLQKPAVSS
jgi:hypothetical protein